MFRRFTLFTPQGQEKRSEKKSSQRKKDVGKLAVSGYSLPMQVDIAHLLIGSTAIVASTFIFSHVSTKKILAEIAKNLYPRAETKTVE